MSNVFQPGISYLIQREKTIAELLETTSPVDVTTIDSATIAVKELRLLLRQIIERPFGLHRVLYIPQADQLSTIIQTTLLKTIEEPPAHLIIILQTARPDSLLGTVKSRVQMIREVITPIELGPEAQLNDLTGADRTQAISVLQRLEQTSLCEQSIDPEKLSIVASAIQRLRLNCNVKLTIDWFLLRWQEVSGTE